jgi:hypothetical protein
MTLYPAPSLEFAQRRSQLVVGAILALLASGTRTG